MKKYKYFLFDLDGTLSDSKLGITKAMQYALNHYGIYETIEDLEVYVGPPLHETFMSIYGFERQKADEAVSVFRVYFAEKGIHENELFDGIKPMLKRLHEEGVNLYITTSKPRVYAEQILEQDGILEYFKGVSGSELDGSKSGKDEVIAALIEEKGISQEEALMIGDRKHDLIGAEKNKIDAVGVLYGYGSLEELKTAKSVEIVETVEALEACIRSLR